MLIEAAFIGDVAGVTTALEHGADVNAENVAAFRHAAVRGYADIVRILIAAGADINAIKDCVLACAVVCGYTKIGRMLLEAGANPLNAYLMADIECRSVVAASLDTFGDAMTQSQREALVDASNPLGHFVRLQAMNETLRQRAPLQRCPISRQS